MDRNIKIEILKKAMAAPYCGKTYFDFLDEEEIALILKAMDEYRIYKEDDISEIKSNKK